MSKIKYRTSILGNLDVKLISCSKIFKAWYGVGDDLSLVQAKNYFYMLQCVT
uniref:Uncharacterized protein n=1 Tax=Arundo donax TaxID=35708 RepID=A0A0A9F155_ARUDO